MKNSWEIMGDFQLSSAQFMTAFLRQKNLISELGKTIRRAQLLSIASKTHPSAQSNFKNLSSTSLCPSREWKDFSES